MPVDHTLYQLINQAWVSSWADHLMVFVSDKINWMPLYLLLFAFAIKAFKKKALWMLCCVILVVAASDQICSSLMKPMFKRVRPCHEVSLTPRLPNGVSCSDSYSMASSHAANHFAIAVFIILLLPSMSKGYKAAALFWAALIAYSRVYCGVHYPSDVLVGALVGVLMAFLGFTLYKKGLKPLKLL